MHQFVEWIVHLCIVMPPLMPLKNTSCALGAECQPRKHIPHWLWLLRSDSKKSSAGRVRQNRIQIRGALLLIFVLGEKWRRINETTRVYNFLTLCIEDILSFSVFSCDGNFVLSFVSVLSGYVYFHSVPRLLLFCECWIVMQHLCMHAALQNST